MKPTPLPGLTRRRTPLRRYGRIAVWVLGIPAALLIALYLILLITPIPLPFLREPVRDAVLSALGPESQLELGGMSLAVEGGTWPVLRFSPVVYTDLKSGAKIRMEALEVGFSPVRALWGQPGATVTMVAPHIQVIQDLFGPRVTSFELVDDPNNAGQTTVRVLEGSDAFPQIGIRSGGIEIQGALPEGSTANMRSDNDWLVYNLEAAESGMAEIVNQAKQGTFSRLRIRDGKLEMNDALYGLFRTFEDLTLDLTPSPDGTVTKGTFSADFGGTVLQGSVERTVQPDGSSRLRSGVTNIDFSAVIPFINDQEAIVGVLGAGAFSLNIDFSREGKMTDGQFDVDMTGMDLRVQDDLFPIASSIIRIDWDPDVARFTMSEAGFRVGSTSAKASGVFALGLDENWGPTVGVSMTMRDVSIDDGSGPPDVPFAKMEFSGWSAPLYGAVGVESFVAEKPGARLAAIGRIDMLREGMGFDMDIGGEGITSDDLKRLWPYFMAGSSREWFVNNIPTGEIISTTMKYNFPVGSVAMDGEEQKPLPPGSMSIDMLAKDVAITPVAGMAPIALQGNTRLTLRDANLMIESEGARYPTPKGDISLANVAFTMSGGAQPGHSVVEISGDISGGIPAVVALAKEQQPEAIASANLPLNLDALAGSLQLGLVATIMVDDKSQMTSFGYAVNGTLRDFGSTEKIQDRTISGGQLTIAASQDGYRVAGQAEIDGLDADVVVQGAGTTPPELLLSSTIKVADLKKMGFDASEILSGSVKFVARPMQDGSLQMVVDLADAGLNIKDLGITKAVGVPGELKAAIRQDGTVTDLSQVTLSFGTVDLAGNIKFDTEKGLQSAEFTTFALSDGDSAQVALTPIEGGGYEVRLRGQQLDLKPMLNRFFKLGEGTGGPQASAFNDTIVLDVELDRALGYYRTTAYNIDLALTLKGTDMRRATMQASFGGERSLSITTNNAPDGRTLSVAFNDLGTLLRFLNVYPNVEGGAGTLVMRYDNEQKADFGTFLLQNFAIVNEENVAQIVGNHRESQEMIAANNKLEFRTGQVEFVRRKDRVEVTDGMLAGDSAGGTLKGFIYTEAGQYDLTGTYVPLFGLSRAIQRVPLLGALLAGNEGEGVFGITFAVRGALDNPTFQANPLSALAVGPFRRIFEYRARELPRVD